MKVCVLGAGAIGSYVGGCLFLSLQDTDTVVLIGRQSLIDAAQKTEQHLLLDTCVPQQAKYFAANGQGRVAFGERLVVSTEANQLSGADLVILAVKSQHTREAAQTIAKYVTEDCVVVSLQNGVSNPKRIQEEMPKNAVISGMVGFNVIWREEGASFQQSTDGVLGLEKLDHPTFKNFVGALRAAKFKLELRTKQGMVRLLHSKLLINLVNPINALSGKPVAITLEDRSMRRLWAASITEALGVYAKAGIRPVKVKTNPKILPLLLTLPTPIFQCIQKLLTKVDREAKSSMLQDMEKGKPTEVDFLNGEIVELATSVGTTAPLNAKIQELVHEIEQERAGKSDEYTGLTSAEIYKRLEL